MDVSNVMIAYAHSGTHVALRVSNLLAARAVVARVGAWAECGGRITRPARREPRRLHAAASARLVLARP